MFWKYIQCLISDHGKTLIQESVSRFRFSVMRYIKKRNVKGRLREIIFNQLTQYILWHDFGDPIENLKHNEMLNPLGQAWQNVSASAA